MLNGLCIAKFYDLPEDYLPDGNHKPRIKFDLFSKYNYGDENGIFINTVYDDNDQNEFALTAKYLRVSDDGTFTINKDMKMLEGYEKLRLGTKNHFGNKTKQVCFEAYNEYEDYKSYAFFTNCLRINISLLRKATRISLWRTIYSIHSSRTEKNGCYGLRERYNAILIKFV